ncbi:hypothetical protein L9F63_024595, partial [Diploptera punctata]
VFQVCIRYLANISYPVVMRSNSSANDQKCGKCLHTSVCFWKIRLLMYQQCKGSCKFAIDRGQWRCETGYKIRQTERMLLDSGTFLSGCPGMTPSGYDSE